MDAHTSQKTQEHHKCKVQRYKVQKQSRVDLSVWRKSKSVKIEWTVWSGLNNFNGAYQVTTRSFIGWYELHANREVRMVRSSVYIPSHVPNISRVGSCKPEKKCTDRPWTVPFNPQGSNPQTWWQDSTIWRNRPWTIPRNPLGWNPRTGCKIERSYSTIHMDHPK